MSLAPVAVAVLGVLAGPGHAQQNQNMPDMDLVEDQFSYISFGIEAVREAYDTCSYMQSEATPIAQFSNQLLSLEYDPQIGFTTVLAQGFTDATQPDWQGHPLAEGVAGEVRFQTIIRNELEPELGTGYGTCRAEIAVPEDITKTTFWYLRSEYDLPRVAFSDMNNWFDASVCRPITKTRFGNFDANTNFTWTEGRIAFVMEANTDDSGYGCMRFGRD